MQRYILAIAVFSGFGLVGCGSQSSPMAQSSGTTPPVNRVVVHYLHRTMRCVSCLGLEKETRRALEESFAAQLGSGQVQFRSEDYQKEGNLAKRFGVDTPSVIVVAVADGREISHENLERVWELKGAPDELRSYIAEAVRRSLAEVSK